MWLCKSVTKFSRICLRLLKKSQMENFIFLYSEVIELKLALDTSNALDIVLNGVIMLIAFLLTKFKYALTVEI